MIKISNLSDYASIVINLLLSENGKSLSSSELAANSKIAQPTVSKVLKLLNEAELVESVRGVNGGYRVVRSAASISIADVICAIDGKPSLTMCAHSGADCQYADDCHLRGNWQVINVAITSVFHAVTFEHMRQSLSLRELQGVVMSSWSSAREKNTAGGDQ